MARKRKPALLLLCALFSALCARAETRVDVGATFQDGDLKAFHLGIGEYFHVPYRDVVAVEQRRLPPAEVPVAFFIAQRARVSPGVVVDLRLGGRSWLDISLHFGFGPEVYYVPAAAVAGPPYGNAYGYYKNKPRKEWHSIVLADDDIVNLVNLRFVSKHYGQSPETVIQRRSQGQNFVAIHAQARKSRGGPAGGAKQGAGTGAGGGEGASEGKGKGQGADKGQGKNQGKSNPGKGNKPN